MTMQPAGSKLTAWLVWGLAVAFVLYLFGFQTGYSVVNPNIRQDVGLSVGQVGLIAATYTWSFAVFQLFSGALLDRIGARRVLLPAIALVTLGVFVFANAKGFNTIIVAQLILALGACAGFVGAGYVGGRWFGMAKFTFMFGLVQFFASMFSAFNVNLLVFALKHMEWRELFLWIGAAGVLLFVLAMLWLRDPAPARPDGDARGEGILRFVGSLLSSILKVARSGHVWMAAAYGALVFGALLAAGVVWAPKLMMVRGMTQDAANLAASVLWLGVAAGCIVTPWWSDKAASRKWPTVTGIALQLAAIAALLYATGLSTAAALALWFAFGLGASAHMIAFGAAADVLDVAQIGTSAAIVNGSMFLVSGILMARPGGLATELAVSGAPVTLALAQRALLPLVIALAAALVVAALIRESHPGRK